MIEESVQEAILFQAKQAGDDHQTFIRLFEEANASFSDAEKANVFFMIGNFLVEKQFHAIGIACYLHAANYCERTGNMIDESQCYAAICQTYNNLGQHHKIHEYHKKALPYYTDSGNRESEAAFYGLVGSSFLAAGRPLDGIKCLEKALNWYVQSGNKDFELSCASVMSGAYHSAGLHQKGMELSQKILEWQIENGKKKDSSHTMLMMSGHLHALGKPREATEYIERALAIASEVGDKNTESNCYVILGNLLLSRGQIERANEYFQLAMAIGMDTGDKLLQVTCLSEFANFFISINQERKALEYLEKAHSIVKGTLPLLEAAIYANIAAAYMTLDQKLSLQRFEDALKVFKATGDKKGQLGCHTNMAVVLSRQGRYQECFEHTKEAVLIAQEIDSKAELAVCHFLVGFMHGSRNERKEALVEYGKALELYMELGNTPLEAVTRRSIAKEYYHLDNYADAYEQMESSITLSEKLFTDISRDELMLSFQSGQADSYTMMVTLCYHMGRYEKAFEYAERGKSRTFLRMMSTSEIRPKMQIPDNLKPLLDRELDIISSIRQMHIKSSSMDSAKFNWRQLKELQQELDGIYEEIYSHDPAYVSLRRPKHISVDEIQGILSVANAVLIEYFVTSTQLFCIVVERSGVNIYRIDLNKERLLVFLNKYQHQVAHYNISCDPDDSWLDLSDFLVKPLHDHIMRADLVYFVPHDVLHYLPLHALLINDKPLISQKAVVYSPAASLLPFFKNAGSGRYDRCASYGAILQSDDESFDEEAKKVAELLHGKHFSRASKTQVLANIGQYDIIHFSCHGFFSAEDPLSSGIMLHGHQYKNEAEGYRFDVITARQLFKLEKNLDAELIMLSACETGVSENKPGDELIGLTRALLYRGAASVIVGLWEVPSEAANELTEAFYQELRYNNQSKAAALQKAMIKVRNRGVVDGHDWSHPYFWAPFVLVGDWE